MDGGALHDKLMPLSLLSLSCFNGAAMRHCAAGLLFRTDDIRRPLVMVAARSSRIVCHVRNPIVAQSCCGSPSGERRPLRRRRRGLVQRATCVSPPTLVARPHRRASSALTVHLDTVPPHGR